MMDVRTAMAVEPMLLELADMLKERFCAKLTWLKTADLELGRRPTVAAPPLTSQTAGWGQP